MSIDFAIVHYPTHEAYELGTGPWDDWSDEGAEFELPEHVGKMPGSLAEVRAFLESKLVVSAPREIAWRERVIAEVWAFIESHPGCVVRSDAFHGWDEADDLYGRACDAAAFGADRTFVQVGSRYGVAT